jgi:hypothetical protein
MAHNFTARINFDNRNVLAVILPVLRRNGMHYEVNIQGFPRFYMKWTAMDRYDIVPQHGLKLPDSLLLAVSDAIEGQGK